MSYLFDLHNTGVSTTNPIKLRTVDRNGFTLQWIEVAGVTTVAGDISNARFTPRRTHPGIESPVVVSFTTSAALIRDDFLLIQIPAGEYEKDSSIMTVLVSDPPNATATADWNTTTSSIVILFTGTTSILDGSNVTLELASLEMPRSIRAENMSGMIRSWNSRKLILDGPSNLTLAEITAVNDLPCTWTTSYPQPGIQSNVLVTFSVSGAIPTGGSITLHLPSSDFSANTTANAPSVTFTNPGSITGTALWLPDDQILRITTQSPLPAYSTSVELLISQLDTPISVRSAARAPATLTTFDPAGIKIDGPSVLQLDAVNAGMILSTRIWSAVTPVAGVTSDQHVNFSISGRIGGGGSLEFRLPNQGWAMATSGLTDFKTPALGPIGATSWDAVNRTLTVTLPANASLSSKAEIWLVLPSISNPPCEMGYNTVFLTTRAQDGGVIDGPGEISMNKISRGSLHGNKTWTSISSSGPGMRSEQVLSATLSGALPSGSTIRITLPDVGWRIVASNPDNVTVSFAVPASSVTVSSASWSAATNQLTVTTSGGLGEGASIELMIKDMINPYAEENAGVCQVLTQLAGGGIVDESLNVSVNAIVATTLYTIGSWIPSSNTPGVVSTQLLTLQTGGRLEVGASICIDVQDNWEVMYGATATIAANANAPSSVLALSWENSTLCFFTVDAIDQESTVEITVTNMRTPSSIRPERLAALTLKSHTGGIVNLGTIRVVAIVEGSLGGSLLWQSLLLSPGPVAGLKTSATLSIRTSGRLPAGGKIELLLPTAWVHPANCSAALVQPALPSTAVCNQSQLSIAIADEIGEQSTVEVMVSRIYNPDAILPSDTAFSRTVAPDGGTIDQSYAIRTGPITCMLINVTSEGDQLVAVEGVPKTFTFQGFSVAASDVVKFVDASTTSDDNCGNSTSGLSDVGGLYISALDQNLDLQLNFTQASTAGGAFVLCYKFGENPFKLYPDFSFTVKTIHSMLPDFGDPNIVVAMHPKPWTFVGTGIAPGDLVRWIDMDVVNDPMSVLTRPDCQNSTTLAVLDNSSGAPLGVNEDNFTRSVQSTTQPMTLSFSESNRGKTFCLCYKFGNEPFTIYPSLQVEVRHLLSIESANSVGSDSVAVVDAAKTLNIIGDGIMLNDRLYFIPVGSAISCDDSSVDLTLRLPHSKADRVETVLFVDSDFTTSVNFSSSAAGIQAMICYKFGNEPYHLYTTIALDVKMITQYTGTLGSPSLAVADVAEPLTFQGYGLAEGDEVRWILTSEELCDTNLASLVAPGTLEPIDTVALDAQYTGSFNFSQDQIDYAPILCYKFGSEPFKRYRDINISIGTIRSKVPVVGDKSVAVVASSKNFTVFGTSISANDRVAWTMNPDTIAPCTNMTQLIRSAGNASVGIEYESVVSSNGDFSVAFTALNSGKRVYMCYGFGSEPFKLYANLYLDIKSVTNLRSLYGSNVVAVSGALKTFLFDGDGVASGDFGKFVAGNDCFSTGITLQNVMKEFDDDFDMAMYLYESGSGITFGNFQFGSGSEAAGLARTLCYRFGSEPFHYYENFQIDVKTIWAVQQNDTSRGGQDGVAVVNEPKLMAINGVGMSSKDSLKFVAANTSTGADCETSPTQGLIGRELVVFENLTMWYPFEYGSNGSKWMLCYKFTGESFRLYPSIAIVVKELTSLGDYDFPDDTTLGSVATVGHVKRWRPIGSGVAVGDTVKFVSQNVKSSAECGVGNANLASGTANMTVGLLSTASIPSFSGTFTEYPVSADDVYHICYKFQDEPYSFIRGFTLSTYGISGISRSVALVDAATTFQLMGLRLSNIDQLGWTTSSSSCKTMVAVTTVTEHIATFSFAQSYTQLYLCYSFGKQPFDIFYAFTLTSVNADIWIPQSVSVVAGQLTTVDVSGTFGLTDSDDQIAWIPSDSVACSSDIIATYSSVLQASIVSTSKSTSTNPAAGAASFQITYVAPTSGSGISIGSRLATWKLCYRFGNTPSFLMFGDVLCDVMNIDQVELLQQSASDTGTAMKFQFDGIGIQDFDKAKWVAVDKAAADADCDTLPSIGGSTASSVINQVATFVFVDKVSAMALCYQFQGVKYKLFANVRTIESSALVSAQQASSETRTGTAAANQAADEAAAAASEQYNVNRDIATVSLTLDKDIADIPPNSLAETAFKQSFIDALSSSLGIDSSRIQITSLTAGSVIVNFRLAPSESTADPLVHEILQDLKEQLQNPDSVLLVNNAIAIKDGARALSATISTLPSPVTSSLNIQALGYQRAGLFSFVKSVYSVTEKSGKLVVPIIREQGTETSVGLIVRLQTTGKTATYNQDYRFTAALTNQEPEHLFMHFDVGQVLQTINIEILDDGAKEAHFEALTLVLADPSTPGSALGTTKSTTVRIFDYDDGVRLASSSFPVEHAVLPVSPDDNIATESIFDGWTIVGNGPAGRLRVDSNGLFAVDNVIGDQEYNQACDLASPTGQCSYACELGGNLRSSFVAAPSNNILALAGDDYVASMNTIGAFPTNVSSILSAA